jgi:hypothetical protein
MAGIYDAFDYMNSPEYIQRLQEASDKHEEELQEDRDEYEEESQKESENFVPLGSKKTKPNIIRFSPIAVQQPKMSKPPLPVQTRRANASPSTMTAMYGIRGTPPIITYDGDLGRPFSPIEVNKSLSLGRASNNIFKPIAQRPQPVFRKSSTKKYRGSPTTYMDYKRSLGTDVKDRPDDWGFHDRRFKGGKKRTRKAGSRSVRSERRKRTKKSYSRRRRSRKIR